MTAKMKNLLFCATMLGAASPAFATPPALPATVPMITAAADDSVLTTLSGDHPAIAAHVTDSGALDGARLLPHILIGLKRPPAFQAALDKLVAEQLRPGSANYRNWLTAADLRAFGPAQADIDKVTAWLHAHGLTVNGVSPSGMAIDVAGRSSDFSTAFHTALHDVSVKGEAHIVNMNDASIPAAFAGVVGGVTFSNLFPKPNYAASRPLFNIPPTGSFPEFEAVVPGDFSTIYNVTPLTSGSSLYGAPIAGAGVTIAVLEQTDIKETDWDKFRTYFGLSGYSGTFKSIHPGGCGDPGYTGDEVEAAIDAEWASAPAPDATIIEASCPETETTFGVMTTLQNMVETGAAKATIYSISYGGCEVGDGLNFLQMWSTLVEEGASEGVSIMVSSGDGGSSCDGGAISENGVGVNGLASNEYDTAVGGTDFYDLARGEVDKYWTKGNGGTGKSSAKSYVPEIPWNNSCASPILAKFEGTKNLQAYCNGDDSAAQNGVGGSGGASIFYTKPDWQLTNVLGMPNDGVRDLPDVSLFAANGEWDHFYLICMSDKKEGGAPCEYKGAYSSGVPKALYQAYGGTSVSAPAFAGILALIQEVKGVRLGNPAPRLYQLAQMQYSDPLLVAPCNASLGKGISAGCMFNNVTAGNNAMPCAKGTPNCAVTKQSTAGIGILSTPGANGKLVPAYPAQPGYSLATGLGTINATNLSYAY